MWFKVEESALDDPRIWLAAGALGLSFDAALVACERVWCWLYRQGRDVLSPEEVDAMARIKGFANAMLNAGLAEATPEGLRIKGAWRAGKISAFREMQAAKSKLGNEAKRLKSVVSKTNTTPPGSPTGLPGLDLCISDLKGSLDPGSVATSQDPGSVANKLDPKSTEHASQLPLIPLVGQKQKPISPKNAAALAAATEYAGWFKRHFAKRCTVTPELVKQVAALLQRGWSEKPDMRGVSLFLANRWEEDDRMRQYIRPSTLLAVTKFAERLDEAKEWDRTECRSKLWGLADE